MRNGVDKILIVAPNKRAVHNELANAFILGMGSRKDDPRYSDLFRGVMKEYIANLSGGKDSLCMTVKLMEKGYPLTKAVFFDTGMEYKAIHRNIEKIKPMLESYGCELVILKPSRDFLIDMLVKPVNKGKKNEHYGYNWCGCSKRTRWMTATKRDTIDRYLKQFEDYTQYIGIAFDEPERVKQEKNKRYPLVEWEMTEKDCLEYCFEKGFDWKEGDVELYDILDRVSCYCCGNKNLTELRNMYKYLPEYWDYLKGLQSRIEKPFRRDGKTIFDLEERFKKEIEKENKKNE